MKRVFLGGTCSDTKYRDELIPKLTIDYFNPVVEEWTEACQKEEDRQKVLCDFELYVITPLHRGMYSIAEVVDSSNKRPSATIFCVLESDYIEGHRMVFQESYLRSLNKIKDLVRENGAIVLSSLDEIANYLNSQE